DVFHDSSGISRPLRAVALRVRGAGGAHLAATGRLSHRGHMWAGMVLRALCGPLSQADRCLRSVAHLSASAGAALPDLARRGVGQGRTWNDPPAHGAVAPAGG